MTRKPWIRISAVVTVLVLCLSLPRMFPIFARASAAEEPSDFSENDTALNDPQESTTDDESFPSDNQPPREGDDPTSSGVQELEGDGIPPTPESQESEDGGNPTPGSQEPGAGNGEPTPDPQQPGADGNHISSEPDGSGDDTALDDFDEGDTPPAGTDEDDEAPEEPLEPEPEVPEEPSLPEASALARSSRSVSGYNVFEVDSYAALAEALSTTSYPSEEYPETSVYILLTGDVDIERGFTLHPSIEKVTIDGAGQHTLAEINTEITYVSNKTAEVRFIDLTITGKQWYGLFQNSHNTDVSYHYEQVTYTGPQILHAFNSTAHFTDCIIHIARAAHDPHEVAEIRNVFIHGSNEFHHNSPNAVFYLYNTGSLVLSDGANLRINATGANNYILFTANEQSTLRLEDDASLHIEGTSSQLVANAGLQSIFLGENAVFDWKAHRSGSDYIFVNASGGEKDALYLSRGAEFRVAPNGPEGGRLVRIDRGNVVVSPDASLSLYAVPYNSSLAPLNLAAGSLTIGESATFTMQIENRYALDTGLIHFGISNGNGFFVDRDATVVIRGDKTSAALRFVGFNSSVKITDPNYLEIAVTQGLPILFINANVAAPSTLTYTDVQQINYWRGGNDTYLNGGQYLQRWVAEAESFTVKATFASGRNGSVSLDLTDPLDQQWTPVFDKDNFNMDKAQILSVGKVGMEVSADGNAYQGRITAPTLGVPYDYGAVQLRVGQPKSDSAVSPRVPATPDFQVAPNQTVGADAEIAVWAEYGYVFHNNPPSISAGTLSLTVPERIEFGVLTVAFSDRQVPAVEPYTLQVQDQRRAGWQVLASFRGFSNAEKSLNSTLLVNDVPLQETPQRIAASAGTETVLLDVSLLVPGGAAESGTYAGNITWTLVDAP